MGQARAPMGWILAGLALAALALPALPASADGGWIIDRFDVSVLVRADATIGVTEDIAVDFAGLEKHGIFRNIPVRYRYDDRHDRVYDLTVSSVTDASGKKWRYEVSHEGADVVIKIGDPDRTVSGKQTYRIAYDVRGVLNGFAEHDELYWNVTGDEWPVPIRSASAAVRLARGAVQRTACYQGSSGSTEACRAQADGATARFSSTRAYDPGEQLTAVVAFPKGVVAEPAPILERRARGPEEWFDVTPLTVGASAMVLVLGMGLVGVGWWRNGRDRRFLKRYYLDQTAAEAPAGLLDHEAVVPEYEPPEKLRPAQAGLVLDERADPLDLTATIVDLAVRGYLAIEEIPAKGLFGKRDWKLRQGRAGGSDLLPYEKRLLDGLFLLRTEVDLSDLKGTFHETLSSAQRDLYRASVSQRWFAADPDRVRMWVVLIGVGVLVAGGALAIFAGMWLGAGMVGIAGAVVGIVVAAAAQVMPSRTATGHELLLRILGFRRYIETAEKDRQAFAEREDLFSEYLPYAIVFGSVRKWARAFEGLDMAKATAGWYAGSGAQLGSLNAFAGDLSSFSSGISSAISSTPGSTGSSGFGGGGSSGGGGGGGGGGSW